MMEKYTPKRAHCEFLRSQSKSRFDRIRPTWTDLGRWGLPHRNKWLASQNDGERNNHHIVDPTHGLALRSFVAGFMEGNTSASRPWYRLGTGDEDVNHEAAAHEWLDILVRRTLSILGSSNFYWAVGQFYYDYGTYNTGTYYIDEMPGPRLHFHNLTPGSYFILNNGQGEPTVLVREFSLNVQSVVKTYGRKKMGDWDWSNISLGVRKMYEDGNYAEMIDIVHIVEENPEYSPYAPQSGANRRWRSVTYECGQGTSFSGTPQDVGYDEDDCEKYLKISFSKRKPFVVGRSYSSNNFEYGETGPTLDAIGLIKSLQKKAISKDQAIEQILRPPLQGPANLKKSYITSAPNSYVPLDANSLSQKGLRTIFEINPGLGALIGDATDLRQIVERIYYADYLMYLSRNPKTRTAAETNAVVNEQQLVIGPNLQSLNWTHNVPLVEYVVDYVLDEDPLLPDAPNTLVGQFLRPEFISVFAQAQRAADLPAIDRYMQMVSNVGAVNPQIWNKVNLDRLADLYEDRLYLPAGLNNDKTKTDALREQAAAQAQQRQHVEQITQLAAAAKDAGINNQPRGNG